MDAKKLVKGTWYDYVRKDGSRHRVKYLYPGVNGYFFLLEIRKGLMSLAEGVVRERIKKIGRAHV